MQTVACNPKMIMSALAQVEMSSSLRDDRPLQGGSDGQRGPGHHECEGTAASACDSTDDGEDADAGEGGYPPGADAPPHPAPPRADGADGRPRVGASGTGQALEPTDPGQSPDQGAEAVCAAVWRFWADVGGGEADRVPRDHGERRDRAGLVTGRRHRPLHAAEAPASVVAGAEGACGGAGAAGWFAP